jgi:hypothetical protein
MLIMVVIPITLLMVFSGLVLYTIFKSDTEYFRVQNEQDFQESSIFIGNSIARSLADALSISALFIANDRVTREQFVNFSGTLLKSAPADTVITLEWLDTENIIRYVYPETGSNMKVVGTDINKFPNRLIPINNAKISRKPVLTDPIRLIQGYPGVVLYVPIYKGDTYAGMAISVIRLSDMFNNIDNNDLKNETMHISTGNFLIPVNGREIYTTDGKGVIDPAGKTVADPYAAKYHNLQDLMSSNLTFADKTWRLMIKPTYQEQSIGKIKFYGFTALFILIILFSLLLVNYRYQIRLNSEYRKQSELRKKLENEIRQRTDVEKNLENQNILLSDAKREIYKRMQELERTNSLMINREMKMVELKKEIAELKENIR